MASVFQDPVPPFPGWERRIFHVFRPVTDSDIQELLGDEDLYVRDTAAGRVNIIHKYGLAELHCIVGEADIEVWYDPENGAYIMEYLDAILSVRF
ncbi:hypothetical protein [Methanogenium organophilum]|uniref:Uncharacterized protein n=1 Tax=Methanogenium organophilum TaxID=2199 RepID=A0A9X9T742_METOG|nr:hypothetical protein [Methanogenium organophilum]WAI00340.1 hypothetical protein OU421_07825 [Methanogenium organophilum]